MITTEHERRFDLFGSHVRLLVGEPVTAGLAEPAIAAIGVQAFLRHAHRALTRFDAGSELCALNADPADERRVSPLLARAVAAGLEAAELTGGLVDPTLVDQIERAGYARSRVGLAPADLRRALAVAPPRAPARPRPDGAWRRVSVDLERGIVRRPAGVRIDTGGSAKGLVADMASRRLAGYELHVVDAGGDMRIGGERPRPREVSIEHPLQEDPAFSFELAAGAVATSGLATRIWREGDGFAHHLLDPFSGRPAWTGVIQATAVGRTAVEAEALAKAALLAGPGRGTELIARHGGALILDDGTVALAGPIS